MQLGTRRNEWHPAQLFTYKEDEIYSLEFGFGLMKIKNYQDMSKPKNFSHNLRLKYSKPKDFTIGQLFMHEECGHSMDWMVSY